LGNDRSKHIHDSDIYRAKVGLRELLHVAEPINKPEVEIGPGQHSLNGLTEEDEISWSKVRVNITELPSTLRTNLSILQIAYRLENCSHIHLERG